MARIAIKTVSYLPDEPFRFKRRDDYIMATKKDIMPDDDFQMTMTLMEFNNEYTCWIGMDMARCDKGFYEVMWEAMSHKTNKIKKDHFFVNGTHTHSGPVFTKYKEMGPESYFKESMSDLAYHCGDVAVKLYEDLEDQLREFTSEIKTINIEGCYSNRNSLNGPCDKNATLIRFKNKGNHEPIGMWFSMNCHSTVTFPENKYVNSDLVGHIWKNVASFYHVPVMAFCGAQGDTSTRLTRNLDGTENAEIKALQRLVENVTNQIVSNKKEYEPITIDRFEVSHFAIGFNYSLDSNVIEENIKIAENDLNIAKETNDSELIRARKTSINALKAKLNLEKEVNRTIECEAFNLGELKFAAISGELVASLGLKIVRHKRHDHRMVVCYINDRGCGYLVEKEEYGKSFESLSSVVPIGIPEVITDMAISELDKFDLKNKQVQK